jgi:raffinose/stachyose/melibiose transport system substrate-binding protein
VHSAIGVPKPLEIDYNGEISAMGGGKVAMIAGQGTWAEANILAIDPKIQIGIMPYPVSEDPTQLNMVAGAGQCLEISKSSKVLTETEDYYNWLFTSDYGINTWFPKVAQLIAPTKTSVSPSGVTLPTQFTALCNDQKIPIDDSAINYSDDGFHTKLGEIMQGYIGKSESETNCITDIQKAWVSLGAPKG